MRFVNYIFYSESRESSNMISAES